MHTDALTTKVHCALNKELMRRMLIKYFFDKGFKEDMGGRVYPPTIQDLIISIPQLVGKIEVQPHVEDINPMTGVVTLGWNLFVLGNKRMYLGESSHVNLREIQSVIYGPMQSEGVRSIEYRSPKRIVSFIVDVLAASRSGDLSQVDSNIRTTVVPGNMGIVNAHGGWFRSNTFVN